MDLSITHVAALRWTISSECFCLEICGSHTVAAYSDGSHAGLHNPTCSLHVPMSKNAAMNYNLLHNTTHVQVVSCHVIDIIDRLDTLMTSLSSPSLSVCGPSSSNMSLPSSDIPCITTCACEPDLLVVLPNH